MAFDTPVRMLKTKPPNLEGQVCCFSEEEADRLVRLGFAKRLNEESSAEAQDPVPDPVPEQDEEQQRPRRARKKGSRG